MHVLLKLVKLGVMWVQPNNLGVYGMSSCLPSLLLTAVHAECSSATVAVLHALDET